jgi:decaprenyl-phosphate phosphoribosyltransferase
MNNIRNVFALLRVDQWIKNLFVFIPIFFAGEATDLTKLKVTAFAFLAFCFTASSIYVVNDLMDVSSDRQHPEKRKRPLAAGVVTQTMAWLAFAVSLMMGILFSWLAHNHFFVGIILAYFLINIGYSLGLKRVSIVEILIVSSGFVLRAIGGGLAADVEVSQWMLMMIFLLALFLALAKRRDDFFISSSSGMAIRKSIEYYNLEYINALLIMVSGIIIVAYLMYVISPEVISRFHSKYLYVTSVFVIAGVMRYLQITLVENKSGSPTKILYRDNFIRIVLLGWVISFYFIIYKF